MTEPKAVAFLGLGVMGYPMAGHLVRAGHKVTVYNRTTAKAEAFAAAQHGAAKWAPTPRAAAEGADFVFSCVGNDDDLRAVTLGENGAFAGMKPGAIFVDHTTASAQVARDRGVGAGRIEVDTEQAGAVAGVALREGKAEAAAGTGDQHARSRGGGGVRRASSHRQSVRRGVVGSRA